MFRPVTFLRPMMPRPPKVPSEATLLLASLISWWKLDEASGTRADSVVASGNDLTDNNTVTQAAGKVGNAGQFTRVNSESLSCADNASLDVGDIDFTFCAWIYQDSKPLGGMGVVGKAPDVATPPYQIDWDQATDRYRFFIQNASTYKIAPADTLGVPATGTWYYIVGWHDATADTVNIQVNNGTVDSVATANMAPQDNALAFTIGRWNGTGYWDGRIDEVGFWKRTLTAAEKTYLYNAGAGRTWSAEGIV